MKSRQSIILFYLVLYVFVILTLFFVPLFLVDFGAKRSMVLKMLCFMTGEPLNPISQSDVSLVKVLINGFVWASIIAILILFISKLVSKLFNK